MRRPVWRGYRGVQLGPVTLSVDWGTDSLSLGASAWWRPGDREGCVKAEFAVLHFALYVDYSGDP